MGKKSFKWFLFSSLIRELTSYCAAPFEFPTNQSLKATGLRLEILYRTEKSLRAQIYIIVCDVEQLKKGLDEPEARGIAENRQTF